MKPIWKSKTVIVNVLLAVVAIAGLDELKALLGPNALQYFATAQTIANVILRLLTTQPVSVTGETGGK